MRVIVSLCLLVSMIACSTTNNYIIVIDNEEITSAIQEDVETLRSLQTVSLIEEMMKPEPPPVCPLLRDLTTYPDKMNQER